jgi:hypothetical protein
LAAIRNAAARSIRNCRSFSIFVAFTAGSMPVV